MGEKTVKWPNFDIFLQFYLAVSTKIPTFAADY
jgi:hypothetical protein